MLLFMIAIHKNLLRELHGCRVVIVIVKHMMKVLQGQAVMFLWKQF